MIILKLSVACLVVTAIRPFVMKDTLKRVHHFYFHSTIKYGIIFWRNYSYSNSIFKAQKGIIRIIMGVGIRDSCRELFKILNILALIITIYILSPTLHG